MSDQISPSYRSPIQHDPDTLFDQYARTKDVNPHHHSTRSTYATLKNSMDSSSRTRRRRLSNTALQTKRVT